MPKEKKKKTLTPNDIMKLEIAAELGLKDKIEQYGWKSLTSKESGKIGGLMTKKKRCAKVPAKAAEKINNAEQQISD